MNCYVIFAAFLLLLTGVQALGMLQWHKHNVDKALADLSNYTSYPDMWTIEDKVLFEQAFSVHAKNFQRFRSLVSQTRYRVAFSVYFELQVRTKC